MKKISLVLSGGGARGLAHIGVLEELEKEGYEIHSIIGTSMGAVVGGFYAAGKLPEFKEWISSLSKRDVFRLVDFTLFNKGFIKGGRVFDAISNIIQDVQIENLPIKYTATATDLIEKKEVLFTSGSLYNAMRASVSIPNVLTPIRAGDALLVDGGVINNIPISHARRIEDDLLIAVNVNANIPLSEKKEMNQKKEKAIYHKVIEKFNFDLSKYAPKKELSMGYFEIMSLSFEMMRNKMDAYSLLTNPPDLLIETPVEASNLYDFYKASELIAIGQNAAKKSLRNFK